MSFVELRFVEVCDGIRASDFRRFCFTIDPWKLWVIMGHMGLIILSFSFKLINEFDDQVDLYETMLS